MDNETGVKRTRLMEQKDAIEKELREMDMGVLAVELLGIINGLRNGTKDISTIRPDVYEGSYGGSFHDKNAMEYLHAIRPEMSAFYMCVVMYHMLFNAKHRLHCCGKCTKEYLDQIDKFAVLRDGRVVGLNHRYAGSLIVPIDEC